MRRKGIRVGKKRVARLMRNTGLVARQKRRSRRTTDSNHASPIAPNLVARNFDVQAPNQVWAGDVTYIATSEGWAYLAGAARSLLAPRCWLGDERDHRHGARAERAPGRCQRAPIAPPRPHRAELVDAERYTTREEAEMSIGALIDRFHNVERLHAYLDFVRPLEFDPECTYPDLSHSKTVHERGAASLLRP